MNLKAIAEQYDARSRFYAEEMARQLCKKLHLSQQAILRYLGTVTEPATVEVIMTDVMGSITSGSNWELMKRLVEEKLVRMDRKHRLQHYRLSDFGRLVLEYLPEGESTLPAAAPSKVEETPRRTTRTYDWPALEPQIDQLLEQGFLLSEIATKMNIPYSTLYHHRYDKTRKGHPAREEYRERQVVV